MKYRIFLITTHFGHKLKTHLHFVTCFYHHWIFFPGANKINIHSYPPYWRLFLHLQPEDAPCRGDRDPLMRPRHWWEDNIKMNLQEVGCAGMDWIELAQDKDRWPALVNAVMNPRVPWIQPIKSVELNSIVQQIHYYEIHILGYVSLLEWQYFQCLGSRAAELWSKKKLAAKVVLLWFHCLSLKNIYSNWLQHP